MKNKFILKFIYILVLITFFLSLIITNVNQYFLDKNTYEILLTDGKNELKLKENELLVYFHFLEDNLNNLRKSSFFKKFRENEEEYSNLSSFMFNMIKTNHTFMQIRYLDKNGKEIIRVDKIDNDSATIIPKYELQDKSDRYYFQNSIKKPLEKIWFSDIDLNVENGKIQIPYKLTLRAIIPIADEDNEFDGILIINSDMNEFFTNISGSVFYDIFFTNKNGNILFSNTKQNLLFDENIKTIFKNEHNDILNNEYFEANYLISNYSKLPVENRLIMVLKLKQEYLDNERNKHLTHNALVSFIITFFLAIVFLFILKIYSLEFKLINRKLKELLENSLELIDEHILVSRTDLNGKIVSVSEGFCNISGYSKEELIGKHHNIIRHSDMPKKLFKNLWLTIKNEKKWSGEIKNLKKNGEFYWAKTNINPYYDENGKHIGYISVRQDITASKLYEEQSNLLQSILDSSDSIIITTDGFTLKTVNKKFFDIFDFLNFKEFKSKHNCICELFIAKEKEYIVQEKDGKTWLEQIEYSLLNNELDTNKVCMIDKTGNERIFKVSLSPKSDLKIDRIATFTEISELIKSRKLLKTQTKHAAMGEMISMIAHQWRQPLATLNVINSKIKIMSQLGKLDNEILFDNIKKSTNIVEHLSNTINDFRNFFDKDNKTEDIQLDKLINKSYYILETAFRENGINFIVNYQDNIKNLILQINSSKFSQVLINLLKNAYDELISKEISNKQVVVNCFLDDKWINIEIIDNAGGIPDEVKERLFEPYFSTKSKNGTGLGLYMSKIIIEDHMKGKIEVSNINDGANFSIKLLKTFIYDNTK